MNVKFTHHKKNFRLRCSAAASAVCGWGVGRPSRRGQVFWRERRAYVLRRAAFGRLTAVAFLVRPSGEDRKLLPEADGGTVHRMEEAPRKRIGVEECGELCDRL